MRFSHALLALTLSAPFLAHAGDCSHENDLNQVSDVQAAQASDGSTLAYTLTQDGWPVFLGEMEGQQGQPDTVVNVSQDIAYVAARGTAEDGTVILVPDVVSEGAEITLREVPGKASAVFVRLDTIKTKPGKLSRGNAAVETGGAQVAFVLAPGKQEHSFKMHGKRYTLALDYAPAQ